MCCFSGPVQAVANTRIFARLSGHGTQFLVYQMEYQADRDLAMILPGPIQTPARETSVRFIRLQKYPRFFKDMERPGYYAKGAMSGGMATLSAGGIPPRAVHSVGNFSASFVPTLRGFGRLDKRFVLPPQTWDKIPAYHDFGFAVFKLKALASRAQSPAHPMAFEFRTRFNDRLFLPTVHIHDGQVHATETFDHALYMQDARLTATDGRDAWGGVHPTRPDDLLNESGIHAAHFMDVPATQKMVSGNLPIFKRPLMGTHANRDTYISLT